MSKLFYTIIFLGAALSLFQFADVAQAQTAQCCILEVENRGSWIKQNSCRLSEPNRPCNTATRSVVSCVQPVTGEILLGQDCPSGYIYRNSTARERTVDCAGEPVCRNQADIARLIVDCRQYDSQLASCPPGACFVTGGRCQSRRDTSLCPQLRTQTDCQKVEKCVWRGNRCLSPLEAGLTEQYVNQERGDILPACAVDGTCRDVDDLILLALNGARWVFSFLGVAAFVMFMYGGGMMILSFGNPEKFKSGRAELVAAVVGIVISLSAYLLINFVLTSLGVAGEFRALN